MSRLLIVATTASAFVASTPSHAAKYPPECEAAVAACKRIIPRVRGEDAIFVEQLCGQVSAALSELEQTRIEVERLRRHGVDRESLIELEKQTEEGANLKCATFRDLLKDFDRAPSPKKTK